MSRKRKHFVPHVVLKKKKSLYKSIRFHIGRIITFVELANKHLNRDEKDVFKDCITSQEILSIKKKYNTFSPTWLTRHKTYRVIRGLYRLPSLEHKEHFLTLSKLLEDLDALLTADEHHILSLICHTKYDTISTLEDIGKELGVSKQRIFQHQQVALKKLEINTAEKMMFEMQF